MEGDLSAQDAVVIRGGPRAGDEFCDLLGKLVGEIGTRRAYLPGAVLAGPRDARIAPIPSHGSRPRTSGRSASTRTAPSRGSPPTRAADA